MGKDKGKDEAVEAASAPELDEAVEAAAELAKVTVKQKMGKGTISAHVFAVAALVASVGDLLHGDDAKITHVITRDDSITEEAYETLRGSIEDQAAQIEKTQDDVLAMRNFLAGYFQASPLANMPARPGTTVKPSEAIAKLLPKADKPPPPMPPPSYQDVRDEAVDEPPVQVDTKKE
jgi:hypothetical protein